ncbi:MAG: alpha/beta hydrolase [Candidatus Firestonebacteria bacterium]|nr:alpha/beta hydrolase [Candidatus Firestonebacteria bacterium]
MKIIILFISIIIVLWILVRFLEPSLIYYPSRIINIPIAQRINYEEVTFKTDDGKNLWGILSLSRDKKGTIIYFHGNAGNIYNRFDIIYNIQKQGFNVLAFDYRGYGKSSGEPDEEGLYKDGKAAFDYILNHPLIDKNNIIFLGESLGGAVAVHLAQNTKFCKAIILISTFTSIQDMSKEIFSIFPLYIFSKSKYDSIKKIKNISVPILIIHGTQDDIVPFSHGEKLFKQANNPKNFIPIKGAQHNDIYIWEQGQIFNIISDFISNLR